MLCLLVILIKVVAGDNFFIDVLYLTEFGGAGGGEQVDLRGDSIEDHLSVL
jgi:hypothetical protein